MVNYSAGRAGRNWERLKKLIYQQELCFRCQNEKGPVVRGIKNHPLRPSVDHIIERETLIETLGLEAGLEAAEDPRNLVMAHFSCNASAGATFGNLRRAAAKNPPARPRSRDTGQGVDTGLTSPAVDQRRVIGPKRPAAKDCGRPGCRAWAGACVCPR
jgi:5-methylcytosine-specific restriction endonuclease McrA